MKTTEQQILDIDKLHVLLRLAIDDLKSCITAPEYDIDMDNWVYHWDNTCYVCLAGAVMVQTLRDFSYAQENMIIPVWAMALEALRTGDLITALGYKAQDIHTVDRFFELAWKDAGLDVRIETPEDNPLDSENTLLLLEAKYEFLKQKDI